jgi:hypothetical protein
MERKRIQAMERKRIQDWSLTKATALAKKFEGYHTTAYKCPAGVWTIGYGHTAGVVEGMTCTASEAEHWLMEDLREARDQASHGSLAPRFSQRARQRRWLTSCLTSALGRSGDPHCFRSSSLTIWTGRRGNSGSGYTLVVRCSRGLYVDGERKSRFS